MTVLFLKIVLTPLLITAASSAQRRWGPLVGGLLVGLPLTSGPVAIFFTIENGAPFASRAARGTLAGLLSEVAFCLVYAYVARRRGWPAAIAGATAGFFAVTATLNQVEPTVLVAYVLVLAAIAGALLALPRVSAAVVALPPPRWDMPARAIVATTFVFALTAAADGLGPHLSGLLSPFPIYAAVIVAFTHAHAGIGAAARAVRGVLLGLVAFGSFFAVLSPALRHLPPPGAFALATAAAVAVQGVVVASTLLRRRRTNAAGASLPPV